jgi:AbrB family looped-hinge helix DNA binding protein
MYKPFLTSDVIVGQRGQVVIPAAIRSAMELCPGDTLIMVLDQGTGWLQVKKVPHDPLERLQEAAGDAFKGIDATEFIRELRKEWDGREERLEQIRQSSGRE